MLHISNPKATSVSMKKIMLSTIVRLQKTILQPVSDPIAFIEKPASKSLFDLSLLQQMNDNDFLAEILILFLTNTPVKLNEMRNACVLHHYDDIYKIAHKLKSGTGLLKADSLLDILLKIEEKLKLKVYEELAKLVEVADDEFKKLELPMREHLKIMQAW